MNMGRESQKQACGRSKLTLSKTEQWLLMYLISQASVTLIVPLFDSYIMELEDSL